jgi:isopenicillin N synthase-like dioxygenase
VTKKRKDKQAQGILAANQDFKKYDQVKKDQLYNLVESSTDDQFDNDFEIEKVDMTAYLANEVGAKEEFSHLIGEAMESIGFVILTGHGIDTELYQTAEKKITELFESTDESERKPYLAKREGSVNQGYFPIKKTTVIHPDLVEGWVFCRRAFDLDSAKIYRESEFWPLANYEPFFRELCLAHEQLVIPIMQGILRYLGCEPTLYDEKLTKPNFGFRLNYYPPLQETDINSGAGRMLGHEDVDLFTILPSQDLDGLQVLNRANMKWIRLKAPKGSIVLNTGDYLQRISNDRLPSTTHRVSVPNQRKGEPKARVSFPMAVYVREQEILEVLPGLGKPKYQPISAIEFHTKTTSKYYGDEYAVTNT